MAFLSYRLQVSTRSLTQWLCMAGLGSSPGSSGRAGGPASSPSGVPVTSLGAFGGASHFVAGQRVSSLRRKIGCLGTTSDLGSRSREGRPDSMKAKVATSGAQALFLLDPLVS